ncbi:MAG: hypothetical protein HGA96_01890 [Desulfobulbaceae bacterium]|nr:hypothetical protein [Desulfobulbaceae bacterium]
MPTHHRQFHRCLVIVLLALLSPIMPGKMNLCLLPGGEMHLEADCSAPCSQAAAGIPTDAGDDDQVCRQNAAEKSCLDFTVGENAARQQSHNSSHQSPPALTILPQPISYTPTGQRHPRELPPTPSPHLKSHQITVLRI